MGNEREAVLVDAGLSCRETERRMRKLELPMDRVRAIFISHEHGDHIRGLDVLSARYQLPVYLTEGTHRYMRLSLQPGLVRRFAPYERVRIGDLTVTSFPKYHDAADPHSFFIEGSGVNVGVFTDLGRVCQPLRTYFAQCHAAFIEANYDERMLESGRYPWHLKNRIRGGFGHLSNTEALELCLSAPAGQLSHIFLSHLSADNNDPDLVLDLFRRMPDTTRVSVASRYEPMPPVYIGGTAPVQRVAMAAYPEQLRLF